jgi:hypothetical protein
LAAAANPLSKESPASTTPLRKSRLKNAIGISVSIAGGQNWQAPLIKKHRAHPASADGRGGC